MCHNNRWKCITSQEVWHSFTSPSWNWFLLNAAAGSTLCVSNEWKYIKKTQLYSRLVWLRVITDRINSTSESIFASHTFFSWCVSFARPQKSSLAHKAESADLKGVVFKILSLQRHLIRSRQICMWVKLRPHLSARVVLHLLPCLSRCNANVLQYYQIISTIFWMSLNATYSLLHIHLRAKLYFFFGVFVTCNLRTWLMKMTRIIVFANLKAP